MIFFLHGAVGHSSDWHSIIKSLYPHQCEAIDLYSYCNESINVAARNINSLGSPGDIIVGYSLGARITLQALIEDNSPWSKAIFISAHTGMLADETRKARVKDDLKWSELCNSNWNQFVEDWERQSIFNHSNLIADRNQLIHLKEKISETFINWSTGKQTPPISNFDLIKIPNLWLTGEFDEKYTKMAAHACEQIPLSQINILSNSGHRVPWDKPKETADAINVFIS